MKLQYGKHSGEDIEDVPTKYLQWLYKSAKETLGGVGEELARRKEPEQEPTQVIIEAASEIEAKIEAEPKIPDPDPVPVPELELPLLTTQEQAMADYLTKCMMKVSGSK